jgi:hypothetical protein
LIKKARKFYFYEPLIFNDFSVYCCAEVTGGVAGGGITGSAGVGL